MLGPLAAFLLASRVPLAGRFDVAERLQTLDFEWKFVPDKAKHAEASSHVTKALALLEDGSRDSACQELDLACDVLAGRAWSGADAITLHFDPPFSEPKTVATLKLTWAYLPLDARPLHVVIGAESIVATPGRDLTIQVHPEALVPELNQSPESGVLVPITVGDQPRSVYLSVVKGLRIRAKAALLSTQPEARTIAERVMTLTDSVGAEPERALIQMLFSAELLSEGRQTLDRIDEISLVHSGPTDFRIAFPDSLDRKTGVPATIVIAMPDADASENAFFDRYGRGEAVRDALQRGWVFASAAASDVAPRDILDWIQTRRKLKVGQVFLIGHGDGGRAATKSMAIAPAALALFSPSGAPTTSAPVFLAYSKQDTPSLQSALADLAKELGTRHGCTVLELGDCDHLNVVSDGLEAAYRFFDSVLKK